MSEVSTATQLKRVQGFSELKPGWDSYDALPIDPEVIEQAKRLLPRLGWGWVAVPTASGGIQLERHCFGLDMELSIEPSVK